MKRFVIACPILVIIAVAALGGYLGWRQVSTKRHWEAAEESEQQRDFAEAEKQLALCRAAWPKDPKVYLASARVARRSGRADDARRFLGRCRDLGGDPDAVALETALARVQAGNTAEWRDYLATLLDCHDDNTNLILEALAQGYIKNFHFADARRCLDQWLDRQDDAQAFFWRGQMLIYFERLDLARNDFERCLKIDPRHREARLALADVLVQMKEPAQALDVFQEIVDEDPSDHAAVLGLARANRSLGHDEKALKIIETLSTSDPDKPEVQAERGQILFELKRYSEAEDWLKKGHGNQVFDGTTVYKLYLCLKELGKTEEAEKYFAQKESMERDAKRLKALVQQLAEHPRDSSLRHETGAILLRAGNESEALRWLNSALTLDPNYKPTHELLAEFYRSKGEIQQAEAHERRVRGETDPPSSGSGRGH